MIDLTAARWRKSSYSGPTNDACVEVADGVPGAVVPVRDSQAPGGPTLCFSTPAWSHFVRTVGTPGFTDR
ncbi:DUF397 domain-containing protein [Streptomyces tubbatahanensis]|uniref:DUF397 domain-containing protein n=1 Tax=Streptomyces tubbatahanensis TaxID=2923272 RepID=A0ABY3XVT7_9ACTN|nr:DUF397 domain-containing protein [Streptomyces tubbatahanensis]UNS98611.1 DUF397 domain-containing protein [Streptomyces tubbatahanensis]